MCCHGKTRATRKLGQAREITCMAVREPPREARRTGIERWEPYVGREKEIHSVVHQLPATPPHVAVGFVNFRHGVGSAGLKVNPGRPRTVALGDASAGYPPVRMSHRVVQSVRVPPRVPRATLAVGLPWSSNVRVGTTFLQADGIVAVLAGEVVERLVLPALGRGRAWGYETASACQRNREQTKGGGR